jgi:hypothetical protein
VATEINQQAPVVGASEIEIAAAPEAVWDVLTAFERWPGWNRDVKSMTMEGDVAPGAVFRWKAGPGTITSTIQHVERPRLLAWTGKTLGIKAIHYWHFEPRDGKTFVRTGVVRRARCAALPPIAPEDSRPRARRRAALSEDRGRATHDFVPSISRHWGSRLHFRRSC